MPRKMVFKSGALPEPVLTESPADNEAQLQTVLREHPEILPLDDFGLTGPMLVIGEETQLASGAVDLVGISRNGELIVIEFKTGPQNSDFRSALAQLVDYGSDLWGMTYEQFEHAVALRYFHSDRCRDPRFRGSASLSEAAHVAWPDLAPWEWEQAADLLAKRLSTGAIEYVLAAQRLTDNSISTIEYMNEVTAGPRFYGVEVVRFVGDDLEAFDCRTLVRPSTSGRTTRAGALDRDQFLTALADQEYEQTVATFLDSCDGLGLGVEWGSAGFSVRLRTPWRREPITLAWLFPPGRSGWMGLTDLALGYDPGTLKLVPEAQPAFDRYAAKVSMISCAEPAKSNALTAWYISPECLANTMPEILDVIASCVADAGG